MEYYGNNDWRDYLYLKHYGVKGMKWGKRKRPVRQISQTINELGEIVMEYTPFGDNKSNKKLLKKKLGKKTLKTAKKKQQQKIFDGITKLNKTTAKYVTAKTYGTRVKIRKSKTDSVEALRKKLSSGYKRNNKKRVNELIERKNRKYA